MATSSGKIGVRLSLAQDKAGLYLSRSVLLTAQAHIKSTLSGPFPPGRLPLPRACKSLVAFSDVYRCYRVWQSFRENYKLAALNGSRSPFPRTVPTCSIPLEVPRTGEGLYREAPPFLPPSRDTLRPKADSFRKSSG